MTAKIKRLFLAFLLFVCVTQAYAQHAELDSLLKILKPAPDDTNKINLLIEISEAYRNSSTDTAIYFAEQAKANAEKLGFPKGTGYALKAMGNAYADKGDYVNGMQYYKQALSVFESIGLKVGQANMLNNIGSLYNDKGMETEALDYFLKSLKTSEEIKDTLRIATALMNLGTVYVHKPATYQKAIDFYRMALRLANSINDKLLLGTTLENIGETFYLINKYDSALAYLNNSIEPLKGTPNLMYSLNAIGKVYLKKREFNLAIKYHQMAFDLSSKLDSKLDMAQALFGMGKVYQEKGDCKNALSYYHRAQDIFIEIGFDGSYDLEETYEGMAACYFKLSDFSNAFKYQKQLLSLKDTLYNIDVDKKLGTKLFAFEIDKKQGEINQQQEMLTRQKLVRNGFIGGFAVVVLFAGVFVLQRNKIGREKKRSDDLLLNILPAEVAIELKAKGNSEAKHIEEVTVLFTDFKGFTTMSEKLTPKELVRDIHEYFSAFDHIMDKCRMEKIKTIGDSYMAAGGLPTPNKTHATDAINAAIEILEFIEEGKASKIANGEPYFEIRIGIHTGSVVAGIVGIKKFAYDIWGDTVNIASRMESSGEVGQINISGSTYDLVKDKFTCQYRGEIEAKNKGKMKMYFVESPVVRSIP